MKVLSYIKSHKVITASIGTVLILGASGSVYALTQQNAPVNNAVNSSSKQTVAQTTTTEPESVETVATPSVTPTPSSTPTPSQTPTPTPQLNTVEDVLKYNGVPDQYIETVKTMTAPNGWKLSKMVMTDACRSSYSTVVKCFSDYAIATYGSWGVAIDTLHTTGRW
jgi:hypothetical protein